MELEWEEIYSNAKNLTEDWWSATYRARVYGGWLIRHECATNFNDICSDECGYKNRTNTMIFISDINHLWKLEDE